MFEAFRASRGSSRPRQEQEQKTPPAPEAAPTQPAAGEAAPAEPQRRTVPDWHRGVVESDDVHVFPLGGRANVVFALSYNALIVAIVLFVVFAVLMGFVGYTIGSRPSTPVEPEPAGPVGVQPAQVKPEGPDNVQPPTAPKWCVQLLTIEDTPPRRQALEENIRVLREQNVPDLELRRNSSTKQITLYAGKYDTRAEAEALATRVKRVIVRGRLEFSGAIARQVP